MNYPGQAFWAAVGVRSVCCSCPDRLQTDQGGSLFGVYAPFMIRGMRPWTAVNAGRCRQKK